MGSPSLPSSALLHPDDCCLVFVDFSEVSETPSSAALERIYRQILRLGTRLAVPLLATCRSCKDAFDGAISGKDLYRRETINPWRDDRSQGLGVVVGNDGEEDPEAEADTSAPEPGDEGMSPISDRLMTELTAHRTLGLRHALGEQPQIAFHAALHALTLKVFYHYDSDSCLEPDLKSVGFGMQTPGLNDSASAEAIRVWHKTWTKALPKDSADLWDALQEWDGDSQAMLFAHVVSLSVNAVHEAWNRWSRALAHADRLAQAVGLDMAAAGWRPTVDTFLGRVTKARILQAVAEAKGQRAADRIEHLKKAEMPEQAETLLAESEWLSEPLRTPGRDAPNAVEPDATDFVEAGTDTTAEETAANGGETAMAEDDPVALEPLATAAE